MMYRNILVAGVSSIAAYACVSNAQNVVVEKKGPPVELNFIRPLSGSAQYDANPFVDGFAEQSDELDSDKEKSIAFYCGAPFKEGRPLAGTGSGSAIISYLAGKLANYIIDGAKKSIDKKLQEYVSQYSNVKPIRHAVYQSVNSDVPKLASRCMRFTRTKKDKRIKLDLVAQIYIDGDAMLVRPLRLFVSETVAKSERRSAKNESRKVTLGIALKSDATWIDHRRGHQATIFQSSLFSETLQIKADRTVTKIGDVEGPVKYYLDEGKWTNLSTADRIGFENWSGLEATLPGWENYQRLPLIPWSPPELSRNRHGVATFVMTATESGLAPSSVMIVQQVLDDNKNKLAGYLKDTIVDQFAADK